jgi:hypothetical protein
MKEKDTETQTFVVIHAHNFGVHDTIEFIPRFFVRIGLVFFFFHLLQSTSVWKTTKRL